MALPNRKALRLPSYDYSQANYYFVTICTDRRRPLFGLPEAPTALGSLAEQELRNIAGHFSNVRVDKYVLMQDHIHVIFVFSHCAEQSRPFPTLSSVVGLYKSGVSRKARSGNIWQKSFYDRVLRNEKEYLEVWRYIDENPAAIAIEPAIFG